MWTLYTGFAYILAALILTLVVGWRSWGPVEITTFAGGPVLIYGVRRGLTAYYEYRISNGESHLQGLVKERDATIEKLKEATKYNSTQQLLEKYGATPKKQQQQQPLPGSGKKTGPSGPPNPNQQQGGRTNIPPPPTANIQRGPRGAPPLPDSPQAIPNSLRPTSAGSDTVPQQLVPPELSPGAEFAPNAFGPAPSAPAYGSSEPRWYDRILDALLGEDESQAKNRIVLICQQCRLVNGQAPPGIRNLEDLGKWRCSGCGALNGVERPEKKIVEEIKKQAAIEQDRSIGEGEAVETVKDEGNEEVADDETRDQSDEGSSGELVEKPDEDWTPAKSTRSKTKGKKGGKYAWNEDML
jgi:endoplasmic reticulum junction formation protein lunapark